MPEMASRLKWMNAVLKEAIQGGNNRYNSSDNGGLKGFCQIIRFLKYNHGDSSSGSNSLREWMSGAVHRNVSAQKQLQNGNILKEAVASLINRAGQGIAINSHSLVDVLQGCLKQKNLELVKQVHDCMKKSGLEENPYVANNLLKCYIGCGMLETAEELFNKLLNKDIVSWTIMIGGYTENYQAGDAIKVYKQLRNEGVQPDAIIYLNVLKACASPVAREWGKDIHAHILRDGFEADTRVGTALVNMYAKCGSIEDARAVFDRIERRDIISWNAMIAGLAHHGHGHDAFTLFHQMQREGYTPNFITYMSILNTRADPEDLAWVKEVHIHVRTSEFAQHVGVNNALIRTYGKCGSIDDARLVFNSMMSRDVVSWNVMIGALAQGGFGHEAFSMFLQMKREGFIADSFTYVSILNPCSSTGALDWVVSVHAHAMKEGLDVDRRVGSALISMYVKIGRIVEARQVFDKMLDRDIVSWTVMIGGLAEHELGHEAFSLFLQMVREGFTPDSTTYVSILNPRSSEGALEWVKEIHAHATKAGVDVDLRVGSALVHMYAKIGSIDDARQVFDKMQDRDVVTWTSMIGGLAQHGHGRVGLQLFEEMKDKGVNRNGHLFVAVLSACSHAGLVDEGRFHFVSMTPDHDTKPALEHHACMVDILGRAGHLEEAKLFMLTLPIKPDFKTWMALLGACKVYNNSKLGELAAKECIKLEPTSSSPYVLLSNIHAAVGCWDQVSSIRSMMRERGIRKGPG